MNKLKRSYIKRALVIPLLILAVLIVAATIAVPKIIASMPVSTDKTHAVTKYNPEDYDLYLREYKRFDELSLNRFVGWISSEDIALGCAVTYDSEKENTECVSLLPSSTEPWNDGCVIIVGKNTDALFRNLHKAEIGDTVNIEFYKNPSYKYRIADIVYVSEYDEIARHKKKNSLIMCLPYKNFGGGDEYIYTLYIAKQIEE